MLRFLCLALFLFPLSSWADLTIIGVRQNIAMSTSDKVYRDFYINGGSAQGLAKGMVITVQRHVPLYDSYQNRSAGDLTVNVAKVKIILVQKDLAVARMYSDFDRADAPLLDNDFILVGDQLDLSSATTAKSADAAPAPAPVAQTKPAPAQISVNTVELSSTGASKSNVNVPVMR